MDSNQPAENNQRLITLNILASKEELELFGKSLKDSCDAQGFKFELQTTPEGQKIFKIVKVKVLGETP